MASFWSRVASALTGLFRGPVGETESPPPDDLQGEQPEEEQVPYEEYQPPQPSIQDYEPDYETSYLEEDCKPVGVYFIPKQKSYAARWSTNYGPCVQDIQSLVNNAPRYNHYRIFVTGTIDKDYPGKYGDTNVTLAYAYTNYSVEYTTDELADSGWPYSATGWVNFLIEDQEPFYRWTSVDRVDFIIVEGKNG